MWNKWTIKRIYCAIHTLTWIRLAHHRWNENAIGGTTYIWSYPHIYHAIENTGLITMKLDRDRRKENIINGFDLFSNNLTSNIPNISNPTVNSSLASQTKCDNIFSDPQSDHIFSHFLGTFLVYIFFLLVCGNYTLT